MLSVIKGGVEMPGFEPGAFHMRSERSTTELHPLDRELKGAIHHESGGPKETVFK